MVVLCLGVVAGYLLGGLLTARAVFRRERERFLRAGGARAGAAARRVGTFERQERQQTEAFALCAGALWPVALPVLALHGLVGAVALDRGRPGAAVRPEPSAVAARIEELERDLRLGPHAEPAPGCPRPVRRGLVRRGPVRRGPVRPLPARPAPARRAGPCPERA
ncbi:hypothetical protein ACFQ2M_02515 [Kitasatospora saccharophila]|uniref:hypothetical protein n=1 Tax=Kitasatospora saccharophila TaxID=407973 RepID=UPI0036316A3C